MYFIFSVDGFIPMGVFDTILSFHCDLILFLLLTPSGMLKGLASEKASLKEENVCLVTELAKA